MENSAGTAGGGGEKAGEEGGVLRLFVDGDRSLLMAGDKGR